jgi:hypothetical protein
VADQLVWSVFTCVFWLENGKGGKTGETDEEWIVVDITFLLFLPGLTGLEDRTRLLNRGKQEERQPKGGGSAWDKSICVSAKVLALR